MWWFDQLTPVLDCVRGLAPPDLGGPGRAGVRCPRRRRGGRCSCGGWRCCRWSASPAATCRGRARWSTRGTGSIRDVALPAGLVEGSRLPSPVFTPSTKAEVGEHDEAIDFAAVVAAVGAAAGRGAAGADAGAVLAGGGDRARGRDHPGRHEVRVRPRRGVPGPRRRGAHPRLVPLLAGVLVVARRRPAVVRQAVRARLADVVRLGPRLPAARAARRTSSPPPASATSPPTSSSPAGRSPDPPRRVCTNSWPSAADGHEFADSSASVDDVSARRGRIRQPPPVPTPSGPAASHRARRPAACCDARASATGSCGIAASSGCSRDTYLPRSVARDLATRIACGAAGRAGGRGGQSSHGSGRVGAGRSRWWREDRRSTSPSRPVRGAHASRPAGSTHSAVADDVSVGRPAVTSPGRTWRTSPQCWPAGAPARDHRPAARPRSPATVRPRAGTPSGSRVARPRPRRRSRSRSASGVPDGVRARAGCCTRPACRRPSCSTSSGRWRPASSGRRPRLARPKGAGRVRRRRAPGAACLRRRPAPAERARRGRVDGPAVHAPPTCWVAPRRSSLDPARPRRA